MQAVFPQHWEVTEEQASALQVQFARRVIIEDRLVEPIRRVAGVDVAYANEGDRAFAAAAIFEVSTGRIAEIVTAESVARFPYSPGLLSFRELPVLAAVFEKLTGRPDLIICDGQGTAHPRRFGLACHIGVVYDIPTIGCAKTRLVGEASAPEVHRGCQTALRADGEIVGAVLRTQDGIKPLYISPGHRISLDSACQWILRLSTRYRIPEPIRAADQAVKRMKRAAEPRRPGVSTNQKR